MTRKYRVVSLDVWGNAEDGYEVNDTRTAGYVELANDADDRDVLDVLIDHGYLRAECSPVTVSLEWSDESYCEVDERATGYPLYQLIAEVAS
jgi:hypothetical protein